MEIQIADRFTKDWETGHFQQETGNDCIRKQYDAQYFPPPFFHNRKPAAFNSGAKIREGAEKLKTENCAFMLSIQGFHLYDFLIFP
jgi:hypothetical protein